MDSTIVIISFSVPLFLLGVDLIFKGLLIKGGFRTAGADVGLCGIAVILPIILIWVLSSDKLTQWGIFISFIYAIISILIWDFCLVLCSKDSITKILLSYSIGTFSVALCFYYQSFLKYFSLLKIG